MPTRRPSRRPVLSVLGLALPALWSCATAGGSAQRSLEVIDAHIRAEFGTTLSDRWKVKVSREELAAEMKLNHVAGAVSTEPPSEDVSGLGVIVCSPFAGPADEATLEAGLAAGRIRCIVVRPATARRVAGDAAYEPAYRLARRYRVPVVLHSGDPEVAESDPRTMEGAVRGHPDVTFVLAHDGSPLDADERDRTAWLGGHRGGPVASSFEVDPWVPAAAEVAYRNPNVVVDGSGLLAGHLRNASHEQIKRYLEVPVRWLLGYLADPGKLMFGSGWPRTDLGLYLQAFGAALPRETWRAVLHDNAARVYRFGAAGDAR